LFKLSHDRFFVDKLRDIADLHTGLGYVEGVTHDCIRHGVFAMSAALDIVNGTEIAD
jgi:hypothetical protein